ncbi:hypothetical protein [Streptomyces asiaticus]
MAEQVSGQGAYGATADFLGCCLLGGQECVVAAVGFAPLVEGAGDVDPVAGAAFGGGQGVGVDVPGVVDGLACVAEEVALP